MSSPVQPCVDTIEVQRRAPQPYAQVSLSFLAVAAVVLLSPVDRPLEAPLEVEEEETPLEVEAPLEEGPIEPIVSETAWVDPRLPP